MRETKTLARTGAPIRCVRGLVFSLVVFWIQGVSAEKYTPPGYGPGQSAGASGFGLDVGYEKVAEDYYVTIKPTLEFGFWDFRIGLQLPLEVLAVDREPKGHQKPPAIRRGTYDDITDYSKIFRYVAHGTHLYFNPDDAFNWSFYFGEMKDGYIGHKTIIYRYTSSYDPTVYRSGLMADLNNSWGGVEVFQSDVWRNEVIGTRGYIRPMGIFYGVRDLFFAGLSRSGSGQQMAMSLYDARDPGRNGGILFGESGSIGQQTHGKIRDVEFKDNVKFVERKNPVTGQTEVVPVSTEAGESGGSGGTAGEKGAKDSGGKESGGKGPAGTGTARGKIGEAVGEKGGLPGKQPGRAAESGKDEKKEKWGKTFWSRWAVGYSVVRDISAPLVLEKDGSNNLVIDPDTSRPRSIDSDVVTFVGADTEFRLSPVKWMDLTPYVDLNRIKDLPDSEGKHGGIDFEFRLLGDWLKISFRPEYREFASNYIPTYFDAYYSVERTVFIPNGSSSNDGRVTDDSRPKLNYLRTLPEDGGLTKGYFGELIINIKSQVILEVTYEDYDGPDNTRVFAGLFVPNLLGTGLYTNGYYMKKGFDRAGESFKFDDRSLAAGELGYSFYGSFYAQVAFQRSWEYDTTQSAYVAKDEKIVSFGFKSSL